MNTRLFIGSLPWSTTDIKLKELFELGEKGLGEGSVTDVQIICDRDSGRPKGFAFITMNTLENAAAAIKSFNGIEYEGRTLMVSEAKERSERRPSDRSFGGGSAHRGGGSRNGGNYNSHRGDRNR